jgi:hypothetical protein
VCRDDGKFACAGIGEVDAVHVLFVRWKALSVTYSCSDSSSDGVDEVASDSGLYVLRTKRDGDKVVKILEVWL